MRIGMALATTVGLLSGFAHAAEEAPTAGEIAEAGTKYQENCMSCHVPPDRRFASDRAWISQIQETS